MTAILIISVSVLCLTIAYMTYGKWLEKQWGIDETRETPAKMLEDGVDYVAAPPAILMGHHFSSIAGAGPINGPIIASVFGWLPVALWCVIGGIFFGGLQDFGSLFASIRNKGKSVGDIIKQSMGPIAGKLFTLFAILVLLLVVASFINVVAGTFINGQQGDVFGFVSNPVSGQSTAMISLLFIFVAVAFGYLVNRVGVGMLPATIVGIVAIVAIIIIGMNVGFAMSRTAWIVLIGIYIAIASLLPVWVLLQPRDYLSSYLLYSMMAIAVIGIFVAAFAGNATFNMPAFTGWSTKLGPLFPALFITVACGACSGFHSLVATGTSSKQLANEKHARLIGYGSMLIESALAIIALIAVGMVYQKYIGGDFKSPAAAFAAGIGTMFGPENTAIYTTIYALLTLAVSVFALTTLDTATRLSRFLMTELFLAKDEATYRDATGIRSFFAHPLFGTLFMVILGCVLGALSLTQIWSLFGAANQLLAGLALMAVCAWLGEIGKNNKMFYVPMAFMLVATETQLVRTIIAKLNGGLKVWGDYFQLAFASILAILAVILVIESIKTFKKISQEKAKVKA